MNIDMREVNNLINNLLNIIKQKDEIINKMALWIDEEEEEPFENCCDSKLSCSHISCVECIKNYFVNEVEE